MEILQVKNLSKVFNSLKAVDNLSFDVEKETITALILDVQVFLINQGSRCIVKQPSYISKILKVQVDRIPYSPYVLKKGSI